MCLIIQTIPPYSIQCHDVSDARAQIIRCRWSGLNYPCILNRQNVSEVHPPVRERGCPSRCHMMFHHGNHTTTSTHTH
nr:MAG TPA: hypothetical protein [Caudoviricetes sp.]